MCPPVSAEQPAGPSTTHQGKIPDSVPKDDFSQSAYKYVASIEHQDILNHSLRVYLLAKAVAEREDSEWAHPDRLPLLFAAAIYHDAGTCSHHDGPQRFEVEGADTAAEALRSHGFSSDQAHDVWVAIALHTSPGIAERISPLARLIRLAVTIDFKRPAAMSLTTDAEVKVIETQLPRGEIEKVLGDSVVDQALRREGAERAGKAPAPSWPGVLLRGKLENPGWEGVNKAF